MASTKLAQAREGDRWRPYKLGAVASLPVTAVMVLSWLYWDIAAIVWFTLYPFWGGLDVCWKTPTRKAISTALVGGMITTLFLMPLIFKYAR